MSSRYISLLKSIGSNIAIYGGFVVLLMGVIGGLLNLTVFLTLRTFRRNSCALYLTIMSIFNIGQLCTGLLPRIFLYAYGSDGTGASLFYCKFRLYFSHICVMISLTCFCLATIDQYCATAHWACLKRMCHFRVALSLVFVFSLVWILHGIPYAVFNNHVIANGTNKVSCEMTNAFYIQYRTYFIVLILLGFLPFSVTASFGSMSYGNIRRTSRDTVPIARRELDKQLTVMVLVQVLANFFTLLPYTIVNILSLNAERSDDRLFRAKLQLASHITLMLYYVYYANSFYVYVCTSKRFRRQLIYVLFRIPLTQSQQWMRKLTNQIIPQ
ncbi:unnamed protein product [Adineta ricciae]|uniref:G-protein coupled receptors family 1 profile domain-containing protein n=1 Tax=Adineta ricciae TaxID=249248 RepID=A0A815FES3_ADIRI|nr:unnamed protein product [Adineta ricciae]CAF1322565.1 unnamed protein product [Adineta ricciae]